jgi:hypothetical protein
MEFLKAHRMADVVRVCGRGVQYRHVCNEDNDSPARREHDVQRAIHRLRILLRNLPTLILNLILLPLNTVRLQQMRKLIQDVEAAASYGETSMDGSSRSWPGAVFAKGTLCFNKGDLADAMYYSVSGRYRLREMGIELPTGQVFGDLGLLAPDNRRTQTIECVGRR